MSIEHEPSSYRRKLVRRYAASGTPQNDIAKVIGITKPTLIKHYRQELDTATAKANGLVAGALFSSAMSGNVTAQIFWLKTRARWSETDAIADMIAKKVESITYEELDASKPK